MSLFFFFQAEDGIRDVAVTGVQTCALPISDELTLQVRARAVVAQLTRLDVVRDPADRLRREPGVRRISEVAPDEALEMGHARRIAQGNGGPSQQKIGVEHRQAFAEPEARDRRLRAV